MTRAWLGLMIVKLNPFLYRKRRQDRLNEVNQLKWIVKTTDLVMSESVGRRTGVRLYCELPDDMLVAVNSQWFDPYHLNLTRDGVIHWLENHITFDKTGEMVTLHDYGEVVWTKEN